VVARSESLDLVDADEGSSDARDARRVVLDHLRSRRRWVAESAVRRKKPVELRLGERERALVLDRVLRREHEERAGSGRRRRRP
jgi:hypothetical protein